MEDPSNLMSKLTTALADGPTKDRVARAISFVHRELFTRTDGRIANRIAGMPVVQLTTTGRKTGKRRPTMLTAPIIDGDRVVLVASYGGDDRDPVWYRNLVADPDVEVVFGGRRLEGQARTATPEEKAELWPRIVAAYSGYAAYQRKTDRDIPVVIVDPR